MRTSVLVVNVCSVTLGLAFTNELLCSTNRISFWTKALPPYLTIGGVVDDIASDAPCQDAADEVDVFSLDELNPDHVRLHSVTSDNIDTRCHH